MHLVPPDVDVGVMLGRLGQGADPVDEGERFGKVVELEIGDELVLTPLPVLQILHLPGNLVCGENSRHGLSLCRGEVLAKPQR